MKKGTRNWLAGIAVGAAVLGGAVGLREKPLEDGWKRCEVYTRGVEYPETLQKEVFDKVYVGIDDTMKHPESDRVSCYDWKQPNEENWHKSCDFRLVNKDEDEKGLKARLTEDLVSPGTYKFSKLEISGFENNLKRLGQIFDNQPWLFEAVENGGYEVVNIEDNNGNVIERRYALGNGKKITAKDTNYDGILDMWTQR